MNTSLIRKYNVPGPRYTSYPTVPYWDETPPTEWEWKQHVKASFLRDKSISLYIHLPFCESLCTYCGCNTRITVNHKVEVPYLETVLKEWRMYRELLGEAPVLRELHLGGGTPTFFSPENLEKLITGILNDCIVPDQAEFGFEGHPNNTNYAHLQTLYSLGFRRVSFGIQDFDLKVQKMINRVQPYDRVKQVTEWAREIGYTSVNFDLIYGLPLQTSESVRETIRLTNTLRPDRIAYYSYAHVPWVKPGQRRYTEADLPSNETKRHLYEIGKSMFEKNGYAEIGMDHFALPEDSLAQAMSKGELHRNFMGYTTQATGMMIGLGASSISDTWTAFAQNLKKVEAYKEAVTEGRFPVFRGHLLTEEDLVLRRHILNLMCRFKTGWQKENSENVYLQGVGDRLRELAMDGLLRVEKDSISIPERGKPFVRNICMAFDARLWRKQPETQVFSSTV
ncbi:oxygen-independent coproporphyrinogen III oxidase [Roseivirga sp. BDSF3-8]|uniref:oxygen-independent coproporphyrinogen III oxidase n=1 Tax=Roseivirga sp. BDSF3-8 TaxID=3241598 RepID=UPI003531E634